MIHQLTDKAIGVQVPEQAEFIHVEDMRDWEFRLSYKDGGIWVHKELPGYYKILGRASRLTEDQWREVVEQQSGGLGRFKDYELTGSLANHGAYILYSALKSGLSLLRSKGLQGESTLILVKQ